MIHCDRFKSGWSKAGEKTLMNIKWNHASGQNQNKSIQDKTCKNAKNAIQDKTCKNGSNYE